VESSPPEISRPDFDYPEDTNQRVMTHRCARLNTARRQLAMLDQFINQLLSFGGPDIVRLSPRNSATTLPSQATVTS
jgi:hypothetical protein